ncbi:MAG: hypothetical protein J7500_15810 [Sphingomonas sp.]|uniref:hypothetical protein n=1 Tax=Sphingomonas sp. TaxID=28214 RepID=UPI001AFFFD5E|nr:hypothetical protein [Sphingomonas sp.]MBO9624174.1 hypothetical protein [Sphingomonas sp.]
MDIDWRIVIACFGAGIGGELIRRYRAFKSRRRSTPPALRNAGFWTDRRLYLAELIFCVVFVALPFSGGIFLLSVERGLWFTYACLLAFALMVFLLMKSLNTAEPQ